MPSPAADVGASLVRYAREKGVDLVVMGARGMGSFKRCEGRKWRD